MMQDEFIESLNDEDGKILVNIAKSAITENEKDQCNIPEKLQNKAGAFVTLSENKSLRGCIGYLRPVMPLAKAVEKAAWNAAYRDPRFNPMGKDEIGRISIEVTVIGELKEVKYDEIRSATPGKYGIYIENGIYSGTLLPQVAIENSMSMEEFIMETCRKAGLGKNCYKNSSIYAYGAKIFR
ncbi:MAG: AmmeMemoRadiSam system protein A [Ferroplasma sp.]|uniref:AmmeMemoRadiSam system protein A n=1 Tax=Ferroplasma sp. TaxID=2591003 RepID=UPI0028165A66|nr:AmmeMemoRadiSam system protein A [Ferroplasma sp.]WMT52065.1 MAG: AmmeMemoRadiSam system protein A [Ferroplasma sp.]